MRKLTFVALAVVAAGCSGGRSDETREGAADASAERALVVLRSDTGRAWTWLRHDALRTHLSAERTGAPQLAKGADVATATYAFLGPYKALFSMREPAAELALERSEVDRFGMTHARFQQVVSGVPVFGGELTAHYDVAGRITSIDASYVPGLDGLDVTPSLDAASARAIAKADVLAHKSEATDANVTPGDGRLVVHAIGTTTPALAYRVVTRAIFGADPAIWVTTIDANTGAILERYNDLQTVEGSGVGVLGDTKKIQVASNGGGYVLTDATRAATITTYTSGTQQVTAEQGASEVTSTSTSSWDTDGSGPGAAVDAHYNAGIVYDYYKTVHGRAGIDGANGAILSTAHFGSAYDNAFWDGESMSYGDGGQLFKPLSAGLDVGSHEFTHGVTQATSNLTYQGQVGALNEAVSDIFGAFIEHSARPDPKNNWIMGEAIAKSGTTGIRDFANPANGQQPDHMSKYVNTQQDNGGVHINSGIVNNAAYLMTMGGKNPTSGNGPQFGIGWEKAEKVWYRVNSNYLQSNSNFASAATATMQAAVDVGLTQNEQNIIDCAWKSTGVVQGSCSTISNPQSTTPPTTGGGTGGATDGTPGSATDGTGTGDGTEQGTSTASGSRTTRRSLGAASSDGCSVGAGASGDLGPLVGILAALLGLARGRRKGAKVRGDGEAVRHDRGDLA